MTRAEAIALTGWKDLEADTVSVSQYVALEFDKSGQYLALVARGMTASAIVPEISRKLLGAPTNCIWYDLR